MTARKSIVQLGLVACAVACSDRGASAPRITYSRTDSAGVSIVASTAPAWEAGQEWRLETPHALQVGVVSGDTLYQFDGAHTPLRLSDGRIVIANGGNASLRYYDSTGNFLMSMGREGQGPGEWSQLYQLRRAGGDTVIVVAPVNQHSFISPEGKYIDRFDMDPVRDRPNIWGLGKVNGDFFIAYSLSPAGDSPIPKDARGEEHELGRDTTVRPDTLYREQYQHFVYDLKGRMIDSLGLLPGGVDHGGRKQAAFATQGYYSVRHDRLFFGLGDRHEVRVYRVDVPEAVADPAAMRKANPEKRLASMHLERILRRAPDRPMEVTPAIIAAHQESQRKIWEERAARSVLPAGFRLQPEEFAYPANFPAQSRLLVDSERNVWEQRYNIPGDTIDTFAVYDPEGVWLGLITMPPKFRISDIGKDYVLGIWRDHEDVQHVRKYRLIKP